MNYCFKTLIFIQMGIYLPGFFLYALIWHFLAVVIM